MCGCCSRKGTPVDTLFESQEEPGGEDASSEGERSELDDVEKILQTKTDEAGAELFFVKFKGNVSSNICQQSSIQQ